MYIGPWQEYKLARLIQNQHQHIAREVAREVARQTGRRPSSQNGAAASPTSSSRSGFSGHSTQSAPAHLSAQSSAQVRLNDYCDSVERAKNASERRRWAPPRPGAASSASSSSTRPYSSSSAGSGGPGRGSSASLGLPSPAGAPRRGSGRGTSAKKTGKPPKAASFEEQRRSRIRHMQRLYGLGGDDEHQEQELASESSTSTSTLPPLPVSSHGSEAKTQSASVVAPCSNASSTPDLDRALSSLQSSILTNEAGQPAADADRSKRTNEWALPTLHEKDPLSMSMSMGSSGGLINWSKNLQPEELSPQATLASFFQPA
eukprot:TRINITY_DN9105_c0_g1_i2.p1 TRINITY_DN9105_c0_g1~~TRINITY_DN9105_c0_g1_i2.p1  ORF type:complete len:317 (-),score=53.48 TRINITY_DN9105_c0_g1_i2:1-951(-)